MNTTKTLRVAFIIDRLTNYRMFSSLIAEGLQRSYPIECWHLCDSSRKGGSKGYLYPSLDKARFQEKEHPTLKLRAFASKELMAEAVADRHDITHIVSMDPAERLLNDDQINRFRGLWCIIMYGQDTFKNLAALRSRSYANTPSTIFFAYTQHLFNFGLSFVDQYLPEVQSYLKRPNVSIRFIGNTMHDPCAHTINKEAVRKKYGIPPGKQIAIYLPYGYLPAKDFKKSRAWQAAFSGLHIKRISEKEFDADGFIHESSLKRWQRKLNLTGKVLGDPLARKWLLHGWHEPAVINSLKRFCRNNDLFLVVKPRRKFDFSEAVYQQADLIVDDNESQYYPSMMQELLSIASIGISFFSWSALEFVYQGVPMINIEPLDDRVENPEKKYWHATREGFIYSCKGNIWNYSIPDFINSFASLDMRTFALDKEHRTEYFNRFLGKPGCSAATSFFNSLENHEFSHHHRHCPDQE